LQHLPERTPSPPDPAAAKKTLPVTAARGVRFHRPPPTEAIVAPGEFTKYFGEDANRGKKLVAYNAT